MSVSEIWSDIHHDIETDFSGSIRKVINVEAVKTSLDNILRTRYGSRVMLPEFGCGLQDMLFSLMGDKLGSRMVKEVQEAIQRWDDRIRIVAIDVYQLPDQNHVEISVRFSVYGGYEDVFETTVTI